MGKERGPGQDRWPLPVAGLETTQAFCDLLPEEGIPVLLLLAGSFGEKKYEFRRDTLHTELADDINQGHTFDSHRSFILRVVALLIIGYCVLSTCHYYL